MENEFLKRGYLLPEGCKDLTDILKLQGQKSSTSVVGLTSPESFGKGFTKVWKPSKTPLPPIEGVLKIPENVTITELAKLLDKKPSEIIEDLKKLQIFAAKEMQLRVEAAAQIARKYGFLAKRTVE